MNAVSVRWVSRMLTPNCTQVSEELLEQYRRDPVFHNSLFRIKHGSTTSILSQNNKACNGTNESVKIVISLNWITLFFHVACRQLMAAKMHKIFTAQKSYCASAVLSLATIRSKHYFNLF